MSSRQSVSLRAHLITTDLRVPTGFMFRRARWGLDVDLAEWGRKRSWHGCKGIWRHFYWHIGPVTAMRFTYTEDDHGR